MSPEGLFESNIYTVSSLTGRIKSLIENSFPPVWVEGELSNFVSHGSGHMYFSLKDENAQLRCAFFRQYNSSLAFAPGDGMQVIARGTLDVYERSGQYQLLVSELKPSGVGALQLAFEQLKARLDAEGLFDEERKRTLPWFPETVGIVTSPTGAAVRDIISVIRRRSPATRLVLSPARVQGEGAAAEISEALDMLGQWGGCDVIIIGRGGGSAEDLQAFNEEAVARAIVRCPVPVISAVGHQTDFTIADFVADHRAPTPSAAAESAVPDSAELIQAVGNISRRLVRSGMRTLEYASQRVDDLERTMAAYRPAEKIRFARERLTYLAAGIGTSVQNRVRESLFRWESLNRSLIDLNPASVLARGYSVVRKKDGPVVTAWNQVSIGDIIEAQLGAGKLEAVVEKSLPPEPDSERSARSSSGKSERTANEMLLRNEDSSRREAENVQSGDEFRLTSPELNSERSNRSLLRGKRTNIK